MLKALAGLTFAVLLTAMALPALAAAQDGTRLITLGTRSGPRPTIDRAQSSNLLIVNGTYYLIDAGIGTTRRLTRGGYRAASIGHIFISHGHDDHTGGLPALVTTEYNLGRTTPIEIYGALGTDALVDGMTRFLTVSSEIRISDGNRSIPIADIIVGHEVPPGVIYRDENVSVTAAENTHFNFPEGTPGYGKYKSYSYRFDTPDRSIVFSGDTGPSEALIELARGADLLVTEVTFANADEIREERIRQGAWDIMTPDEQAGYIRHMVDEHLTQEEVGRMAAAAGIGAVLLTHLPSSSDPNENYQRFRDVVQRSFSGDVFIAEDLGEY
jgi:ribonuclease BN (tRNA processing enzyme)